MYYLTCIYLRARAIINGSLLKSCFRILAVLFTATGCENIPPTLVDRYATNANALEFLQSNQSTLVNVGPLTSVPTEIMGVPCLSGEITLPDNESYAAYIRTALISELAIGNRYSKSAPVTLNGTLESVKLSFIGRIALGAQGGIWDFLLTVNSSNGASVTVAASHSYHTGWAPIRCHTAAQYLMPAVQTLINELITNGEFESLLR